MNALGRRLEPVGAPPRQWRCRHLGAVCRCRRARRGLTHRDTPARAVYVRRPQFVGRRDRHLLVGPPPGGIYSVPSHA